MAPGMLSRRLERAMARGPSVTRGTYLARDAGRGSAMELVTGATGYVGGRLIERLVSEQRPVRALARNPDKLAPAEGVEAVAGDLVKDAGLREALDGIDTAYYLVHSMERAGASGNGDFG